MSLERLRALSLIPLFALVPLACQEVPEREEPGEAVEASTAPEESTALPVVAIRTTDYSFHAPSEIRSGWNSLTMTNEGQEPHFLVLWKLPEGKTFDDYVKEVYDPFMDLFGKYKSGTIDRDTLLAELGPALPEWLDLTVMGQGGVGLVSPGRTGITTVDIPAGNYVMECYMVDAKGQAHNKLGMLRPLVVTAEVTGAEPPSTPTELRLSNDGMELQGELRSGEQTIAVTVTEAPQGFLGHDAHLARLDDDASLDRIVEWMSWIDGMNPPAPAEFLGGAEQVPAGDTTFVTVTLEPGRYAWISEAYASQGVMHEFTIE